MAQPSPAPVQTSDPFGNVSQPPQVAAQPAAFNFMAQASSSSQGQSPSPGGDLFSNLNVKGSSQQPQQPEQPTTSEQDKKPKDAWAMGAKLIKF